MKIDVVSEDIISRKDLSLIKNSFYNNEMIGAAAIYFVMEKFAVMSPSKAMLIIPLSTHNALISYLNDSRTKVKGLEQLIIKKPELFSNFNQRFYSFIDLSINSLLILIKLDLVYINQNGQLQVNTDQSIFVNSNTLLGIRAQRILKASSLLADLLMEDVGNLYLELRVEI